MGKSKPKASREAFLSYFLLLVFKNNKYMITNQFNQQVFYVFEGNYAVNYLYKRLNFVFKHLIYI